MKILFLDIDDVIAHYEQIYGKEHDTPAGKIYRFDPKSVKVLNSIIEESDCEVVISSDWKRGRTLQEMTWVFKWNEIIKPPYDFTPDICYECKTHEINKWVEMHKPEKWVAIDDFMLGVKNFVLCDKRNEGIKQTGKKQQILSYLL